MVDVTTDFIDRAYYRGTITRQEMVESRDGYPVLNVFVKLEGRLADIRRPDAGLVGCPQVEVMASLRFPPNNPQSMEFALSDLEQMGFTDEDFSKLAPGHPRHHSLTGRVVHIMPTKKEYNGRVDMFWNLRFPRAREYKPVDAADLVRSKAAQEYKEALARRKQQAKPPF